MEELYNCEELNNGVEIDYKDESNFMYVRLPNGHTVYIDWTIEGDETTIDVYQSTEGK